MGSIYWIYIPEILTDAQFGAVMTVYYINGVEISLCSEYMIKYLQPQGTFLFFSVITLLGAIFIFL